MADKKKKPDEMTVYERLAALEAAVKNLQKKKK